MILESPLKIVLSIIAILWVVVDFKLKRKRKSEDRLANKIPGLIPASKVLFLAFIVFGTIDQVLFIVLGLINALTFVMIFIRKHNRTTFLMKGILVALILASWHDEVHFSFSQAQIQKGIKENIGLLDHEISSHEDSSRLITQEIQSFLDSIKALEARFEENLSTSVRIKSSQTRDSISGINLKLNSQINAFNLQLSKLRNKKEKADYLHLQAIKKLADFRINSSKVEYLKKAYDDQNYVDYPFLILFFALCLLFGFLPIMLRK